MPYRQFASPILFSLLFLFTCSSVRADLILTAPPRENAAKGAAQYAPLAKYLSEIIGEKVTYQQPKGWLYYQRDMRAGKYDIVFDGPHFMSWRMKQFDHEAVAMLPGKLIFYVVTNKNSQLNSLDDLVNQKLCAIAPPNLSALTILEIMDNPVRQPVLITGKGGMNGVYKRYKAGKCVAAIMRDKFFKKKVSAEDRANLKIMFRSTPVPNQGITVSKRVSSEMIAKIKAALTEENPGTAPIIKRFSPKAKKMLPPDDKSYIGPHKLLTGVIFGWEITEKKAAKKKAAKKEVAKKK